MRLSLWSSRSRTWRQTLLNAQWAEGHNLDGFWYADHLMPREGASDRHGETHDCWSTLAAIAVATPTLRVTSMVSPVSFRHPLHLIRSATEVNSISTAGCTLGVGAGWQINEHSAYGFELLAPRERVERLDEALHLIRLLSTGQPTKFDGKYFSVESDGLAPAPDQRLRLVVGGSGPRVIAAAARWAHGVNNWANPATLIEFLDRVDAACEAEQRLRPSLLVSCQALLSIDSTTEDRYIPVDIDPQQLIRQDPDRMVETLRRYASLGVDEFGVSDAHLPANDRQRIDVLEQLYERVLIHVREVPGAPTGNYPSRPLNPRAF